MPTLTNKNYSNQTLSKTKLEAHNNFLILSESSHAHFSMQHYYTEHRNRKKKLNNENAFKMSIIKYVFAHFYLQISSRSVQKKYIV